MVVLFLSVIVLFCSVMPVTTIISGRLQGGHSNKETVGSASSCRLLEVDSLSRWMTQSGLEIVQPRWPIAKCFITSLEMLCLRPESWFPHAQFSLCRKWVMLCNDLLQSKSGFFIGLCGFSQRFSGTAADESDTLQTAEKRSYSLEALLALHNAFICLPSLAAFPLPARLVLPVIELFSDHLSAVHRLLLRVHFLSSCAWVYVCVFCFFFLASVSSCQYSFSNTSHLSETGFHMIICKAVFGSVIQEVLMYGKRRAEQIRCEDETSTEAQTTHAMTEHFNNGHKYSDGGNTFLCILKRGDVSALSTLWLERRCSITQSQESALTFKHLLTQILTKSISYIWNIRSL